MTTVGTFRREIRELQESFGVFSPIYGQNLQLQDFIPSEAEHLR